MKIENCHSTYWTDRECLVGNKKKKKGSQLLIGKNGRSTGGRSINAKQCK